MAKLIQWVRDIDFKCLLYRYLLNNFSKIERLLQAQPAVFFNPVNQVIELRQLGFWVVQGI